MSVQVNTARGAICNEQDVADALKRGDILGYAGMLFCLRFFAYMILKFDLAGDVWFPQPAPKDHPWRSMKHPDGCGNGMVGKSSCPPLASRNSNLITLAHYSGTTLDAQKRYADGAKSILENFFDGKKQEPANLIVENVRLSAMAEYFITY